LLATALPAARPAARGFANSRLANGRNARAEAALVGGWRAGPTLCRIPPSPGRALRRCRAGPGAEELFTPCGRARRRARQTPSGRRPGPADGAKMTPHCSGVRTAAAVPKNVLRLLRRPLRTPES
jgi:hypothetical protein